MKSSVYQSFNWLRLLLLLVINVLGYLFISSTVVFSVLLVLSIIILIISISLNRYEEYERKIKMKEMSDLITREGEQVLNHLPIGVVVISSQGIIKWVNPYFESMFTEEVIDGHIEDLFENILVEIENNSYASVELNYQTFRVEKRENSLYFFNDTDHKELEEKYNNERVVVGFINLDNYDDYIISLDEERLSSIMSVISKELSNWASKFDIYLRKYSRNRYIMLMDSHSLSNVIVDDFSILENIRFYGRQQSLPLTISLSLACNGKNIVEISEKASEGLEFVLNRGGDQVVVNNFDGENQVYGGLTDAIAKRSRSSVRMISQSIANLVSRSKNVIIMGHKYPDYDSIGACVGISKFAHSFCNDVKVVLNKDRMSVSSKRLLEELEESEFSKFIVNEEVGLSALKKETLVIVVDTHRTSLVESEAIVKAAKNTVVIDHHRRSEDIVNNIVVSLIEPYASSTSELITEIFSFQSHIVSISSIEATTMLAGITVDTKHFVYRTGKRTFEAAALLNNLGADSILIQDLLKEEVEKVKTKNKMLSTFKILGQSFAISVCDDKDVTQELLAQTADELLMIRDIKASFAIGRIGNMVHMSARSLGSVNVQMIMEKLGGGGHMTAAATQVETKSTEEVVNALEDIILGGATNESNIS